MFAIGGNFAYTYNEARGKFETFSAMCVKERNARGNQGYFFWR